MTFLSRILMLSVLISCLVAAPNKQARSGSLDSPLTQQRTQIEIGGDRAVVAGDNQLPLVEPSLAVNPKDANNILAGAMVAKPDGTYGVAAFSSLDGGQTWKRHDFAMGDSGDVWVVFLSEGTAMFSTLAGDRSELQVFRSNDGGRTWPAKPTSIGFGHDHPTLIVDRRTTPGPQLYAVSAGSKRNSSGRSRSSINVARSVDGGLTFETPTQVI